MVVAARAGLGDFALGVGGAADSPPRLLECHREAALFQVLDEGGTGFVGGFALAFDFGRRLRGDPIAVDELDEADIAFCQARARRQLLAKLGLPVRRRTCRASLWASWRCP